MTPCQVSMDIMTYVVVNIESKFRPLFHTVNTRTLFQEVTGWNLWENTVIADFFSFVVSFTASRQRLKCYLKLGLDPFLSHIFVLFNSLSSCDSNTFARSESF
jgi:hypothetical protein